MLEIPAVSVIIPTHNRAEMVPAAIKSALRQTREDIEIIVVDDGSDDNTEGAVKALRDERIRYIRHPNSRGGSAARNTGIKSAVGRFIAFLDDDDEWYGNKLEKQLGAIGDCDVILCGARLKSNGAAIQRYKKPTIGSRDVKRGFIFGGGTSTLLGKSQAFKDTLFDEGLPCNQDWDLLVRLVKEYRVRYIPDPLIIFNDGLHQRITNTPINVPIEALEIGLLAVYKHRDFLGPLWFDYHIARRLLFHIKRRDKKILTLLYTLRRCGLLALLMVYCYRLEFRVLRDGAHQFKHTCG